MNATAPLHLLTVENGVAVVTLNRPEAMNSLNTQLRAELTALLPELDLRDDVRVIVLTGAGDKAFCSGADLKERAARTTASMVHDRYNVVSKWTSMVANLKSCRIVERDPQGRWDVREHVSKMTLLPSVRSVFRSDYEPTSRIAFHRTAGDLKEFEGEWRLTPHGGRVQVTYEARVAAPFSAPGWMARIALRHDVPMALLALRREAMARAPQTVP